MAIPSDAVAQGRVAAARPGSAVVARRVGLATPGAVVTWLVTINAPSSPFRLLLTGPLQLNQDVPGRCHVLCKTAIP